MDCRKHAEALQQYAEGELGAASANELEAHLRDCASCRRELAIYRQLLAALPQMPDREPPVELHSDLMTALRPYREALHVRRESQTAVIVRRVVSVTMGMAFIVAMAASLWGWVGRISAFAGRNFSQDLVSVWDAAKDLWYLLQLLADVVRILGPSAGSLVASFRQTHAPALQLAPVVFVAYGGLLLLGAWLCWRAIAPRPKRRWTRAT